MKSALSSHQMKKWDRHWIQNCCSLPQWETESPPESRLNFWNIYCTWCPWMTSVLKSPTFAKQKYPSRATEYNNLFRKWPLLKNRKRSRVSLIPLNNIKSTEAPVHCKSIQNILVICETNCCMSRRVPVDPLRSPIFSPTSADWISSSQCHWSIYLPVVYVIYYCNDIIMTQNKIVRYQFSL